MESETSTMSVYESLDKLSVKKKFPKNEFKSKEKIEWKKSCFRCTRKHEPEKCPVGNI